MKTIILNDISNSSESIIPYGLRLARALESEVDILHVVDPRTHQGSYSSVSDSQSISLTDTRSHAETIEYEKLRISLKMDKLLSAEASRLNYPLKINRIIVENSLEEELEKRISKNPNCLLVVNTEADHDMLEDTSEVVQLIKKLGVPAIAVPPGETFKDYTDALMPLDLDKNNFTSVKDLTFLFEHFHMSIDAVGVAASGDYTELELKSIAWKDAVSDYYLPLSNVYTNILEGDNFNKAITHYFKRNHRDLLIIINDKNGNKITKSTTIQLLNDLRSPALVYFPN